MINKMKTLLEIFDLSNEHDIITNKLKAMKLESKIETLKVGSKITFINYEEGLDDKNLEISAITEKAICVDGDWFPKSQIVDLDLTSGEILFNAWFAKKHTDKAWKNRVGGAY